MFPPNFLSVMEQSKVFTICGQLFVCPSCNYTSFEMWYRNGATNRSFKDQFSHAIFCSFNLLVLVSFNLQVIALLTWIKVFVSKCCHHCFYLKKRKENCLCSVHYFHVLRYQLIFYSCTHWKEASYVVDICCQILNAKVLLALHLQTSIFYER